MTYSIDNSKPTLGIDVDLTTLRSDRAWWIWLKNMTMNTKLPNTIDEFTENGNSVSYCLANHFDEPFNDNVDYMDFWRNEGVYDTVEPVEGAVESIKSLMTYFNIVFVTHNKGNGGRSKFNNLARHFGRGNFGHIVTKEKYLARIDTLIDDRNDFLNDCAKNRIPSIRINTPYIQNEPLDARVITLDTWADIRLYLLNKFTG